MKIGFIGGGALAEMVIRGITKNFIEPSLHNVQLPLVKMILSCFRADLKPRPLRSWHRPHIRERPPNVGDINYLFIYFY